MMSTILALEVIMVVFWPLEIVCRPVRIIYQALKALLVVEKLLFFFSLSLRLGDITLQRYISQKLGALLISSISLNSLECERYALPLWWEGGQSFIRGYPGYFFSPNEEQTTITMFPPLSLLDFHFSVD